MIVNTGISPYASERHSKVRLLQYLEDTSLLASFENKVLEASLVQECYMKQNGKPHSELTVKVDNRDGFFDVTDKSNVCYQLNEYTPCELFISSVEYGKAAENVKKCRMFFSSFSGDSKTATLKYSDLLAQPSVSKKMVSRAYSKLDTDIARARELFESCLTECGYSECVRISDEVNNAAKFGIGYFTDEDGFGDVTVYDGFYLMSQVISEKSELPTVLTVTDDGAVTMFYQNSEVSETITPCQFTNYEVLSENGSLVVKVRDRGNILRQLGDVVEIRDSEKVLRSVIYKQKYDYKKGILSGEWEGLIL